MGLDFLPCITFLGIHGKVGCKEGVLKEVRRGGYNVEMEMGCAHLSKIFHFTAKGRVFEGPLWIFTFVSFQCQPV